jgi:hypothetical protein
MPFLGDPPQHLDAGDDVQRAVQPAAVRHRVDVPPDEDRAAGLAVEREPLVARSVDLLGDAGVPDLFPQPLARALPGLRPRDPLRPRVVAGQSPKLLQLGDGPARIEGHGARIEGA